MRRTALLTLALAALAGALLLPASSAPAIQLQQLRVVEVPLLPGDAGEHNSAMLEALAAQLQPLVNDAAAPSAAAKALRELGQVRWVLPAGRYRLARPLLAPQVDAPLAGGTTRQNVRWHLVGQRTHLIFASVGLVIDYTQPQGIYHETAAEADILLEGLIVTALAGDGLRTRGGGKAITVRDCEFVDCAAAGWSARGDGLHMDNVKATGCDVGLDLDHCHQVALDITARACRVGVRMRDCGAIVGAAYAEGCGELELDLADTRRSRLAPGWLEGPAATRARVRLRRCDDIEIHGQAHTDSLDADLDEATALLCPQLSRGWSRDPDRAWGAGARLRVPHDSPLAVVAGDATIAAGEAREVLAPTLRLALPAEHNSGQLELWHTEPLEVAAGDVVIVRARVSGDAAAEAARLRLLVLWAQDGQPARHVNVRALERGAAWRDLFPAAADGTGRVWLRVIRDAGGAGAGEVRVDQLTITRARAR